MKYIVAALLALFALLSPPALAQPLCVCVGVGCRITTDAFPPGADQPTSCTLYKGSVSPANIVVTSPVVASTSIPVSNAASCLPPDAAYNPGVAGSVACDLSVPAQPAGNVTWIATASNARGEGVPSAARTFQLVAALPTTPGAPSGLRVR